MANTNFRDLYSIDQSSSTGPAPGGLPELLQQVIPRWHPQPGVLPFDPASLFQQPSKRFDAQQLQAWQAEISCCSRSRRIRLMPAQDHRAIQISANW
jgi:hypothetical protein